MPAVSKQAKANVKKREHELDEWYKSHGLCPRCHGKHYCKPGYVHCEECLAKIRETKHRRDPTGEIEKQNNLNRRQRLIEQGLCPVCGKRKPVEGRVECARCRQNKNDSQRKFRLLKKLRGQNDT